MYGAFIGARHCHDQKQLFGQEAVAEMPYIECAPDGLKSQTALCQAVPEADRFPHLGSQW